MLQEREQADDGQGIEHQSHRRTHRERHVAEAQQDVEEDGNQGDKDADEGTVSDVLGNRRTHLRGADDGTTLADVGILERRHVGLAHESSLLQAFVEHQLGLVINGGAVRFNLIVRGHTNRTVVGTQSKRTGVALGESFGQNAAYLLGLHGILELNHVVATAREVDAAAQAHRGEADDKHGDSSANHPARGVPRRHEAELRVLQQVLRERRAEREAKPAVFVHLMLIDEAREEHGREERADDTDDPRRGEAADGTRTEHIEDDTRDDRRQVRVEDSRESVVVTSGHGLLDAFSSTQLFLDALIDEHVGIHRRTERQHHTGNTAHREGSLERGQDSQGEEDIDKQCQVGHHTRNDVVHHEHIKHQQHEGDDERHDTLLNRLSAERRTHHFFLHDAGGSRHTTRLQRVGQVFGFLNREVTGNLGVTARNFIQHARG